MSFVNYVRTTQHRKRRPLILISMIGVVSVIAFAAALVVNLRTAEDEHGLVFVIPVGASDHIEVPTVDSAIEIPTDIVFTADEVAEISIVNEDSVANRAGPWVVGPRQSYTLKLDEPGEYRFDCSVDPSESVVVTVLEP